MHAVIATFNGYADTQQQREAARPLSPKNKRTLSSTRTASTTFVTLSGALGITLPVGRRFTHVTDVCWKRTAVTQLRPARSATRSPSLSVTEYAGGRGTASIRPAGGRSYRHCSRPTTIYIRLLIGVRSSKRLQPRGEQSYGVLRRTLYCVPLGTEVWQALLCPPARPPARPPATQL